MENPIAPKEKALLEATYQNFNNRDIEACLANMQQQVEWPNAMQGGFIQGQTAIRTYWTFQWTLLNPRVEPIQFEREKDNRIRVMVHQVVHDLAGNLLTDQLIEHFYTISDGLISRMEIGEAYKI